MQWIPEMLQRRSGSFHLQGRLWIQFLGDARDIGRSDYFQVISSINAEYYANLLMQLRKTIKIKRTGKLFHWDNAPTHKSFALMTTVSFLNWLITFLILLIWLSYQNEKCLTENQYRSDIDVILVGDYFLAQQDE